MSRTYRRRHTTQNGMWSDLWYFTSAFACDLYDMVGEPYSERFKRIPFEKNSPEYIKGKARFHSDMGTTSCKEPGPHWFRNLYSDRPLRRHNKNELRKYILDHDYEPICLEYWKLDYWT